MELQRRWNYGPRHPRSLTMEVTMVGTNPRRMKASEFKAKCLKLMDEIAESGESVVITKNGRPVSRLVPYVDRPKTLFGIHREEIEISGDVISPIEVEWEALG
jgi:prevent-host-death family protein